MMPPGRRLRAALTFALSLLGAGVAPTQTTTQAPTQAQVRVELPAAGVSFGEPFELVVIRTLSAAAPDEAFDERLLRPLSVELLSTAFAASGLIETRRYRARCYALGDVVLPSTPPVTLVVRSILPEPPGELEWPGDGWPLPRAASTTMLVLGLAAIVLLGAAGCWRWLRARAPMVAAVDGTGPSVGRRWSAREQLQTLALPPSGHAAVEQYYLQLKAIVRRHCIERLHLAADVRTSEELLASLPVPGAVLAPCLQACDITLFGAATPALGTHEKARAAALAFVAATEEAA